MRLRLSLKIPLLVVGAALAAGLAVALVDYSQTSRELRRAVEDKLQALLEARTIAISDYLSSIQRDLRSQASNPFVVEALSSFLVGRSELGAEANAKLQKLYVAGNPYAPGERSRLDHPNDPSIYSLAHNRFHPQLRDFAERYGYRDLLLLDLDGNVVYSLRKQSDFATNVAEGADRDGGLARAYRAAVANGTSGQETFVDFSPYGPSGDAATGFVAAPVYGEAHQPIGVLAFEMPVDRINRVMQVAAGLGRTGETLIVGPDLSLRSDSRFDSASTILKQRVAIDALKRALAGESGLAISAETRRNGGLETVLVAYKPLDFLGTRWAVAAKADLDEVYAPVRTMRDRAIINGIGIALLVALIGFLATRLIVIRPLSEVTRAVRVLASGERDAPIHFRPRGDEIGDIARALVLFRDSLVERDRLAAEKQREAVLIEAGRRFRAIAEANPVALLVADRRDGRIRYANPAAIALLGLPGDGKADGALGDVFSGQAERALFIDAGAEGMVDHFETRLRRADGTEFPVALSSRALDYDGAPCLVVGIVDLTEREAAQAEIERQREMIHQREKLGALGSLLAGVAHELNNPLSIVVAQATLLQELAPDAKTAARGEKIRAAAERCARIVKTFLAMARQRPPVRTAVDVNEAVGSAIELLGYSLKTAGIEIRLDLAADLPPAWADADQLTQVLMNLIVNAQQAMVESPGPRRLLIATGFDREDGVARLSIADSGPGIPAAIRPRIFEPFFTTKPIGAGTGVGLSVCHGIVTSYGGTIAAEDAPGGGAVFIVRLPIGSGEEAAAAPTDAGAPSADGGRVLVVDDEPEVAETLAEILENAGWRIDTAESGQAALERILAKDYDIVLSDIRMPNLGGLELYRRLKQLKPGLAERFIVVTGDTLSGAVRAFLEETGLPCIEKPFVPAEVSRLVAATAAIAEPGEAEFAKRGVRQTRRLDTTPK
jgi:PAS domain S-box-containing protein